MKLGNCPVLAIEKFRKAGGYLMTGRNRRTRIPHAMWARSIDGMEIGTFRPAKPITPPLARAFPVHTAILRGRVRVGTGEAKKDDDAEIGAHRKPGTFDSAVAVR